MPTRDLLRIQEVATAVDLTTRAIRFYEEQGLLTPSARSSGSYRLYDAEDVERLRTIKGLRDDAGFSLAEIGSLLEDEQARDRDRAAFHATPDLAERRRLLAEGLERADRQLALLRTKVARLQAMAAAVEQRRGNVLAAVAELEASESTQSIAVPQASAR